MVHGMNYTIRYVIRFNIPIDWYEVFPDVMKTTRHPFEPPKNEFVSFQSFHSDRGVLERIKNLPILEHEIFTNEKYFDYLHGPKNAFFYIEECMEGGEKIKYKREDGNAYNEFMESFHNDLNANDLLNEKEKEVVMEIKKKVGENNISSSQWEFHIYKY